MDSEIDAFLTRCSPVASEVVEWGERMRLRATACLGRDLPPLRYVTSVRAIVLRHGSVLVQQDRDSRHILPGGRREGAESLEATLRREVAEETGWSLGDVDRLGFIHYLYLDPIQPGYRYPYPDFFQIVHVADAIAYSPDARLDDGYEVGAGFLSLAEARRLPLTENELIYLNAALGTSRPMP